MGWQLIEVGLVTTLSIWVFLFSPSSTSRLIAAAVFGINLLWVIFERERPRRPASARRVIPEAQPPGDVTLDAPAEPATSRETPPSALPQPPGPKRVI